MVHIGNPGRTVEMPLTAGGKRVEIQAPTGAERVVAGQFVGVAVIEPAARVLELIEEMTVSNGCITPLAGRLSKVAPSI